MHVKAPPETNKLREDWIVDRGNLVFKLIVLVKVHRRVEIIRKWKNVKGNNKEGVSIL
jgi:hypothetical protein